MKTETEKVTPDTVNLGDRVVAIATMTFPKVKVEPGDRGTIKHVDRERWVVYIRWDKKPWAGSASHYMMNEDPVNPWWFKRICNPSFVDHIVSTGAWISQVLVTLLCRE